MDNDSIAPSTKSKVKSSVQRGIRQNFLDSYPGFEPFIDEILPKKAQLDSIKLFVPSAHQATSPHPHSDEHRSKVKETQ